MSTLGSTLATLGTLGITRVAQGAQGRQEERRVAQGAREREMDSGGTKELGPGAPRRGRIGPRVLTRGPRRGEGPKGHLDIRKWLTGEKKETVKEKGPQDDQPRTQGLRETEDRDKEEGGDKMNLDTHK